jgi:tetratricopeptide (TPR) repeat protein
LRKIVPLLALVAAVLSVVLIPQTFIHGDWLALQLQHLLRIQVDPAFTGGEVLASFLDPMGDDHGEGALAYPRNAAYQQKGVLDLVRYTVHKPLIGARWAESEDLWQVAISFNRLDNPLDGRQGFSHPVIHIYIDLDGAKSGSTETAFPRSELVTFDPEHPWDFVVHVDGFAANGFILSADRTYRDPVTVVVDKSRNAILVRMPLRDPQLKAVLDGRPTYHYVLVGAYDAFTPGNFMRVAAEPGLHNGGGAVGSLTPRVYDLLVPEGKTQETILGSYQEDRAIYAVVPPVEVGLAAAKRAAVKAIDLARLKADAMAEARQEEERARAVFDQARQRGAAGLELAVPAFEANNLETAERAIGEALVSDPENAIALAVRGSLTALYAKNARSTAESTRLVMEAFQHLDRAVGLAKNDAERVATAMHRAYVAIAVPEEVFGKSRAGAEDFVRVAEMVEATNPVLAARCAYLAGTAYRRTGETERAEIYFARAAATPALPSSLRYQLQSMGFAAPPPR